VVGRLAGGNGRAWRGEARGWDGRGRRIVPVPFSCQLSHRSLLDAGYDSERTHRLLRYDLGIRSIIPPKIGRPTRRAPTGHFRARMIRHFPKKTYGQRWQAETGMSMIKRRQGDCLQAVTRQAQNQAMALKAITHNIMILTCHPRGFLQSIPVLFSCPGLLACSGFRWHIIDSDRQCLMRILKVAYWQ